MKVTPIEIEMWQKQIVAFIHSLSLKRKQLLPESLTCHTPDLPKITPDFLPDQKKNLKTGGKRRATLKRSFLLFLSAVRPSLRPKKTSPDFAPV